MNKERLRSQALKLRAAGHTQREIADLLKVPLATVGLWTRGTPLPKELLRQKRTARRLGSPPVCLPYSDEALRGLGDGSQLFQLGRFRELSPLQKGTIAEAAVAIRLTMFGFDVYSSIADGSVVDLVAGKNAKLLRLQVRWVQRNRAGRTLIQLRKNGCKTMNDASQYDFLVGYDLFTDSAFVFSSKQLRDHSTSVSPSKRAKERWDLLERACDPTLDPQESDL